MITKELLAQWASEARMRVDHQFYTKTTEVKGTDEELGRFAAIAAAHGAAQRDAELLSVDMESVGYAFFIANSDSPSMEANILREDLVKDGDLLYSATQLAAARLQGEQASKRVPLTDDEFLRLILQKGTTELVGLTTFVGGSIQMHGKTGLLRSAKLIKEFVEAAHGIKEQE